MQSIYQLPGYPGTTYKSQISQSFPQNQHWLPGYPGTTYKYMIYGHFPKINISYQGTPQCIKNLIYGHFPKINIRYQGTPVQPINT